MAVDWAAIRRKLPTGFSAEDKAKREALFTGFDPNKNGYLSLAEVDKGIRDVLELDAIFDCKPVIMRAFQAAKSLNDARGKASHGPDYVEKCEFRMLLVYLRQYFELWQMFSMIDTSGDRRITKQEFLMAVPLLERWSVSDAAWAASTRRGRSARSTRTAAGSSSSTSSPTGRCGRASTWTTTTSSARVSPWSHVSSASVSTFSGEETEPTCHLETQPQPINIRAVCCVSVEGD